MRLLPLLLLLPACAAAGNDGPTRDQTQLVEELAGRTPGPARDCVAVRQSASLRPVDANTLAYDDGSVLWVNRLPGQCPGLRSWSTVAIEVHGSQFCRNDQFRALEPGSSVPGAICRLGTFVPYRKPN